MLTRYNINPNFEKLIMTKFNRITEFVTVMPLLWP